ncbi:large ribosomal subunit protein eL21x/eL21w-like [Humulus lupulus]|uniref:large ribosomal subunit protein eL21x/eL21w-like n=1 Tax=Humulus lupulus TaxID=3486 RepID=UPI002B4141AD|nr:large ribosomal subunit protein eL21x/eL21w-like [Humulus lupulus]
MPNKFYHGRTGRVWNITKHAIGVEVNKQVGNRIIKKRIHVRVEHVQPSRCTEEFRNRKLRNDKLKAEAKLKDEAISTKRQPEGPKPGFMVEGAQLETVTPIPYDVVNDLKGVNSIFAQVITLEDVIKGMKIMRVTLIYLSHLDHEDTKKLMLKKLSKQ